MLEVGKLQGMYVSVSGFEGAIKSMRNPKNSWGKSDSYYDEERQEYVLGEKDLELCCRLISAGNEHRKFLRMIHVQFDIKAPFYMYKEMDTYKVGTTCNSCSTMHKLTDKKFTVDDFYKDKILSNMGITFLVSLIDYLNELRQKYLETKDKKYWYEIVQLLPENYKQLRTYDMDYETLLNIYNQRKNHKLDEWHDFCNLLILQLPYMAEFIEAYYKNKNI